MAHRLVSGGSEKCGLPHGHNEVVTARLQSIRHMPLDGIANMVEPFERAKATWHRWIDDHVDHSLHLSDSDPLLFWFLRHEPHRVGRILVTSGGPSTEILACCTIAKLNAFLAADGGLLRCVEIRIEETPTNTVTFEGDPREALAKIDRPDPWWFRPDMTINDLQPDLKVGRLIGEAAQ